MRLFLIALMALPLCAQDVSQNRITVGLGGAAPEASQNLEPSTALEFNYGRRFTRYVQADMGLETSFDKDYRAYSTITGTGVITTTNYFVPVGGRILVPLWGGRIEPSFGLGVVYRRDQHNTSDPNQVGAYGLLGASYALDSRQRHRVGVTMRYMNFMSAGTPHPRWTNVFAEYTFSWGE